MPTDFESPVVTARAGPIRGPQNFVAGLSLVALAAFALWATSDLPQGTLRAMGPAMLPRWLAIGVAVCGICLVIVSLVRQGASLESWTFRGPIFIALGIVCFAFTIRLVGLLLAGPLAVIIGGFASDEVRWKEILIFGTLMTLACIALFRYALGQPMPVLIIPGVIYI
jgi:putative tricarboxylic transport membrane protein